MTMYLTYEKADALLATARSEARGKPVANNTRLFRRGPDVIALRLHQTDVVTFHADGRVTLDSGGWRTMTTKDRMNYSPLTVFSDKGEWLVKSPGNDAVPYFDGITFADDGTVLSGGITAEEWKEHLALTRKRRREVRKYVDGYIRAMREGIRQPDSGDCWYCLFQTDDGKGLGDAFDNHDHLFAHLEDDYYVPSLLVNAMKDRGYASWQTILFMALDRELAEQGTWKLTRDEREIRDSLTKYLWKRLKPVAAPKDEGVLA